MGSVWLIGADEAGYGPNLGPLVVATTAWRLDGRANDPREIDLYQEFSSAVAPEPTPGRLAIADSKQLYKPGGGIAALELAALALHKKLPKQWSELVSLLDADPVKKLADVPWHEEYEPQLPLEAQEEKLFAHKRSLYHVCESIDCQPSGHARMVFPEEFNTLVEHHDSKGAALSHLTMGLVKEIVPSREENVRVLCVCDKHGGRNRYGGLLQHFWPEAKIETFVESRAESRYRLDSLEIAFRSGGEQALPVAWASMIAKYLRELSMAAFNRFWSGQVEGIRPTAGYPVDAKRFKQEIEEKQVELGIADHVLWRNR